MAMYDRGDFNGTELRAFAGNFLYSTGANESAGRLKQRRARLLDRVHDGAGNDPAGTREGDWHAEVHQFSAGIADGEVERACAVEGDHAGEVAYGVQAERVAVDRDLRAGARATDGPADDGGPVQDGQRTEGKELWDRIGSSARDERERERADHG